MTCYSANDLSVISGAGDADIESVEVEFLKELSADVVLRVRILVGTYCGHPTLEPGSTVWVLSPDVAGHLALDRSLISNLRVVEEERSTFAGGVTLEIMVPDYDRGVREMFPAFLNMAHLSADAASSLPSER